MTTKNKKSKPVNKKFRKNVQEFRDCDYRDKLKSSSETVTLPSGEIITVAEYYRRFEGEFYANELNRHGSIHRQVLTEEEFETAKKETFSANNSQNRDVYGIQKCSNLIQELDNPNFIEVAKKEKNKLTDAVNVDLAFEIFLQSTMDELNSPTSRGFRSILIEYGIEMVILGASLSKQKAKRVIKRRLDDE